MTIITHDPHDPEDAAENATAMMADVSVWTAEDWRRMLDASAAGATVDGRHPPPAPPSTASSARPPDAPGSVRRSPRTTSP